MLLHLYRPPYDSPVTFTRYILLRAHHTVLYHLKCTGRTPCGVRLCISGISTFYGDPLWCHFLFDCFLPFAIFLFDGRFNFALLVRILEE